MVIKKGTKTTYIETWINIKIFLIKCINLRNVYLSSK